jgi:hypothetical protein
MTYISDTQERPRHKSSPNIQGYCCQYIARSFGKPESDGTFLKVHQVITTMYVKQCDCLKPETRNTRPPVSNLIM